MENKTFLVTGTSSGIGLALARLLLKEGHTVIGASIDEFSLPDKNYRHEQFDQSNLQSIKSLTNKLSQEGIVIDHLALHAGVIPRPCGIDDITEESIDKVINTNLKGTFYNLKYLGALVKPESGSICITSSVDGLIGEPYAVMYSATKAGLISLMKSFARYYGKKGIRVNSVSPGLIDTPLTASTGESPSSTTEISIIKRMGTPEEIAQGIYYLLSDKSSYVTGHNLVLDGGFTLK